MTADHDYANLTSSTTVAEPKTHNPVSKKASNTSTVSSGYGSNRDSKISATSSRDSLISTCSTQFTSAIPEESSCCSLESPMAKDHSKEEYLHAKSESPICLDTDTDHPMRRGRLSAFIYTRGTRKTEETEKIEKSRRKAYNLKQ